jgi:hypothetical protein
MKIGAYITFLLKSQESKTFLKAYIRNEFDSSPKKKKKFPTLV